MASETADVVDDLLGLEDGDVVTIGAEQYEWGSPYTVRIEDDVEFVAAVGDPWRARRLRLEPDDARASDREIRVAEGLALPDFGPGYGRLTDVDLEEDTVFVATGSAGSGDDKRYHEDEDCTALAQADNVHEKPSDSVPHHAPCGHCADAEIVFVTSGVTSPSPTYHVREDCPSVKKADNVRELPRKNLANKDPCKRCAVDEDADEADGEIPEACDWLQRPADVIVEDAVRLERTLEEVLDVVERADGWLQVHQRIAAPTTSKTKDLLWELGLRKQSGALLDDDEIEERVDALRQHYVDDEPTAADGGEDGAE